LGRALLFGAWAHYAIAALCVVIALQMLELIDLPIDRFNALLPVTRPERRGIRGAFIFGMLFGLVASPCSTPILVAIATIAATTGSAARGAALLFVYGLGKGVPLLLLGVASGSLGLMRRVSSITPWLTKLGGVGLLVAAGYLVWLA
jgi:cytochrome c-type biogenesis protein